MVKRFLRVAMLLCVGTLLLGALSLQTREAQASPASGKGFQHLLNSTSCGTWSVVPSPNPTATPSGLSGVAAVSATDVWAVGDYAGSKNFQTLTEHWDGSQWSVVKSPNVGSPNAVLNNIITEVVAISASDIWTSGDYVLGNGNSQTLLEHWNGSKWSVVQTPNIGSHDDYFQGMAADSANDLWAVGADNDPVHHQQLTLIEHCC